jgi:hypothetical protein
MTEFAKVGLPMWSAFPGLGRKRGLVMLLPEATGLKVQVTIAASPGKADVMMAQARAIAKLHLKMNAGSVATSEGNLYISYRDRPHERQLVRLGLDQIKATCS